MTHKIIIRIPNWLGDAVMASPAIWDLIEQHPDSEITLLGLPLTVSVFQHSPYNITFMVYDREGMHKGTWGMMNMAARLRKVKYDLGYLMTHSVSSALIFKYGNVKKRIAYGKGFNRLFINQFKKKLLQKKEILDAYESLQVEFEVSRSLIEARTKAKILQSDFSF